MSKKTTPPSEPKKTSLLIAKSEAEAQIKKQIDKLPKILANSSDYEQAKAIIDQYAEYNKELLSHMFDNDAIVREYNAVINHGYNIRNVRPYWGQAPESDEVKLQREVEGHIKKLESILQRLELIPELPKVFTTEESNWPKTELGSGIFIVHGHDDEAKMELEHFVSEIGLTPIILHRKPDEGLTIIEKFEKHSNVGFALILITPDDEVKDSVGKIIKRARQNVIFEMGFFVGKLGRGRVCCLMKEDVEIPSDISGVIYKPFKSKIDEVKYALITELKAAGYKLNI